MTNEQKDRVESIYYVALRRSTAAEREAYLNSACGNDTELRASVEEMLDLHARAGDFLETPIFGQDVALEDSPISEAPGTTIDRYKLLEKIGEGGMAVVYMAEQEKPIHRKVALKIIKLGMDTRSVIARFEAERQALAMMDHPNIAKVLDAGATESGRPYFVMDLVPGLSITKYCDKNKLSIEDRLKLFISVCSAVQHAHQKGIIHRDIKPSNIMVTTHDGKPVPKVIDFGIAKATNRRLTEKTLFTRYAHIIGTPAYMSPEQAELSDLDVDTRTDIYSLGVLLYELLTGTTPFSEKELREAGFLQMQKMICEKEPTKPSTKLSALGKALTDVANLHSSRPELMRKLISGDLDWIVMKSLEKDRSRRYDTTSALAVDVQRHLEHEPVLARAPSATYRLRKFLRRHRSQAIAAATIVVLAGALTVVLSLLRQNQRELADAEYHRDKGILTQVRECFAREEYQRALEHVQGILKSPHVGPEAQFLYASILVEGGWPDAAETTLKALVDERREIAGAAYSLLARIYLEDESADEERLEKAHEYQQMVQKLSPGTAEAYFLRAVTASTIRDELEMLEKALYVDPSHHEACRLSAFTYYASQKYERLAMDARVMTAQRPEEPLGYSLLAVALRELGHYEDAVKCYESAVNRTSADDPQCTILYGELCDTYLRMGQYENAIEKAQERLKHSPDCDILHFRVFCAQVALGNYEQAIALFDELAARDHDAEYRFRDWSMKYVFDILDVGGSWHPKNLEPKGVAFVPMLEAEKTYSSISTKARRVITNGFTARWSPDGTKLAYSMGVVGRSGIATHDLASGETELLIAPGKDPAWSPDGQYIAFVRDRQTIRIPELAVPSKKPLSFDSGEIWIIRADGTKPRKLTYGSWPSWSQDSKLVYYYHNNESDNALYSIAIDDREAQAERILTCSGGLLSVSPDGEYVAYVNKRKLNIVESASKLLYVQCTVPPGVWGGHWSPSGRKFSMGGGLSRVIKRGLWIYDLDTRQVAQVLSGQITTASWSPDSTKLALSVGPPFFEIWVADLDHNISIVETLGTGRTMEQYYQEMVSHYSDRIEADSEDAEGHFLRSKYRHYLGDVDGSIADVNEYADILNPPDSTNASYRVFKNMLTRLWRATPANLGSVVNSESDDGGPCISADGLTLYFHSSRRGHGNLDIWKTTRETITGEWGKPENLGPPINSESNDDTPSISADGLSLYFSSNRPGGRPPDLWFAARETPEDPWGEPVNLGSVVNSPSSDWCPSISSDGLSLHFSSNRPGGYGRYDMWVTRRDTKQDLWGKPVNLGFSVNSPFNDYCPSISNDGLLLFFASLRPNTDYSRDLWIAMRATTSGPWSVPVNPGPTINSSALDSNCSVSVSGSTLYFTSDRQGGSGGSDLWQVPILGEQGTSRKTITLIQPKNRQKAIRERR